MDRLAKVELQCIMRFLPMESLVVLQRCSRFLLQAADDDFSWACTNPVAYNERHQGVAARRVLLKVNAETIQYCAQVTRRIVHLTTSTPKHLDAEKFPRLKHITIWEEARTKDITRSLAEMPSLSSVDLAGVSPYEPLDWLATLPHLTSLCGTIQVYGTLDDRDLQRQRLPQLHPPALYHSLAACMHVHRLELTFFEQSSHMVDFLVAPWASQFASQLRHLDLCFPPVRVTSEHWRAAFTQMTSLETLRLKVCGCYIACLSQVDAAPKLETIELRVSEGYDAYNNRIGRPIVPSLDMLQQLLARAPRVNLTIIFQDRNAEISLRIAQRDLVPHINTERVSFSVSFAS